MLGIDQWEYTNHALLVVGWGSEMDHKAGKEVDYWIARNSWGADWGTLVFFPIIDGSSSTSPLPGPNKDGYVKILRGVNFGGIESQAVAITPDPCRGAFRGKPRVTVVWDVRYHTRARAYGPSPPRDEEVDIIVTSAHASMLYSSIVLILSRVLVFPIEYGGAWVRPNH